MQVKLKDLHVKRLRPILVRNSTMLNILEWKLWMRVFRSSVGNCFKAEEGELANLSEETFGLITFGPRMSMTT